MTHWLIAKTDPNKEFAVAQAFAQLGHSVWVPTQISVKRKSVSVGPGITLRRREAVERPLMPSVVFVQPPDGEMVNITVRHLRNFWAEPDGWPRMVSAHDLVIFKNRVEEENAREIARIKKSELGRRKAKRTFRVGDPSCADQLKALLFGQEQQEAA